MKISQAIPAVNAAIDADIPVMLWGAPGIGKSELAAAVADGRGARFFDIRLNLFDPVDLRGLPAVVDGGTVWLKPGIWPDDIDGREIVLLFDEIDRSAAAVMSAAMQIVLDRRIGEHALPSTVRILAAGNGKTDRTGTNKMPAALANRFAHFDIEADIDSWKAWAGPAGIDPLLIAFLSFRSNLLHSETVDGRTFPSPRAWQRVNRVINHPDAVRYAITAGLVGAGPAAEFEGFARVARQLPSPDSIIANPAGAPVPGDPSALYAVATAISARATRANFENVLAYARRLPREFEVMAAVDAVRRDSALCETSAFVAWAARNRDVTL